MEVGSLCSVFVISLIFLFDEPAAALQCLNDAGKPVDWFVVYKIPHLPDSKNPLIQKGLGHFYMDVNSPQWKLSPVSLNTSGHAIYNTLKPIYSPGQSDMAYVMYNDEKPTGEVTEYYGHTKGVIGFDEKSGFWLVHSTPKFPPEQSAGYSWPETALRYGQSFLCVTYHYHSLDTIGSQFHYNYPWVYDYKLPTSFRGNNPNLTAYLDHKPHPSSPPWGHLAPMVSLAGEQFLSFAKFSDFDEDLYSAWLAQYFKSDFKAETWQNGVGKLPSNCTGAFKVYNVKVISLPDGVTFKETEDHSKWAVTTNNSPPWICIGDINRQEHQMKRGGGTVCFKQIKVFAQFTSAIADYEKCPKPTLFN